jgi:hypothetical protein
MALNPMRIAALRAASSVTVPGLIIINFSPLLHSQSTLNHWLKIKNPAAPAVRREAEEGWGCT